MQKQANCTKGEVGEKKIEAYTAANHSKQSLLDKTHRQRKIESLHRRVRSVSML